ncbi:MAG: xanthine dehydrogenase family protein subunit M [Candidatus Binatia bacterium]
MKPPKFDYHRPTTLAEALELLERYGDDGKVMAGGQSLMPLLSMRLSRPAAIIDINALGELAYLRRTDGHVAVGALTRQRLLESDPTIAEALPVLGEVVQYIGHVPIRNRGTVGGSLAHADPAAELPAVMTALDATFTATGRGGARQIPAAQFFAGYFTTALRPTELLTAVEVPALAPTAGFAFEELARRHGDFAIVAALAVVELDGGGRCSSVRLSVAGAGPTPVRLRAVEARLTAAEPTPEVIRAAAETAGEQLEPVSDIHASADYRREMVRVLTRRSLLRAVERARAQGVSK